MCNNHNTLCSQFHIPLFASISYLYKTLLYSLDSNLENIIIIMTMLGLASQITYLISLTWNL